MTPAVPFLSGAYVVDELVESWKQYPFNLPLVKGLDLSFSSAVTIFVGENGTGKSTLLQALAVLMRLPAGGGGLNQLASQHDTPADLTARLADVMRPKVVRRPRNAWFFRADMHAHFANALYKDGGHHAYLNDPNAMYADRDLHTLSHGEAFLATLNNRARDGLLFFDEPESALSPQRQLALLSLLARTVSGGRTQVVMATHSPIIMTFPGAVLLDFDGSSIQPTTLEETSHYKVTQGILQAPGSYWKHLLADD